MAASCNVCEVRLFGSEVLSGVCEFCIGNPRPTHHDRRARKTQATCNPGLEGFAAPRVGVQLAMWANLGVLFTLLVVMAALIEPSTLKLVMWLSPVVGLLGLAAVSLCCAVPRASGLRPRAILAGVLLAVSLAGQGLLVLQGLAGGAGIDPAIVGLTRLGVSVLSLASGWAFYVLLAALARVHGNRSLATRLVFYPVVALVGVIVAVVGAAMFAAAINAGRHGEVVLMGGACLLAGVGLLGYAVSLLNELADAMGG